MYENDINDLDIHKTFSEYKGIDLIVGGPPCQGFSQKGKRLGIYDKRNFLFRKYLEIIDNFSDRCVLVDGNLGIDTISDIIWKEIRNRTSIEDD